MIDVFHAIAACDDLIHYWDVAKHADGGVLVRANSQRHFPTESLAVSTAHEIAPRLAPRGYDVRTLNVAARAAEDRRDGWHAFVEVVIGAPVGIDRS